MGWAKWFLPRGLGSLFFVVLLIPFWYMCSLFLVIFLPDVLFYNPLTFYAGPYLFTPTFPVLLAFSLPLLTVYSYGVRKLYPVLRYLLGAILLYIVFAVSCMGLVAIMMGVPSRFNLGHPYCKSPFIETVTRCEGQNFGFMQARLSGVVMYGGLKKERFTQELTGSEYQLKEVPCDKLVGGLGQECYTGSFFRHQTGDTNFLNLYINGENILVVLTENVPIGDDSVSPRKLQEFFDIERFREDMSQ